MKYWNHRTVAGAVWAQVCGVGWAVGRARLWVVRADAGGAGAGWSRVGV